MAQVLVFGRDDAARVRFASSPLWETFAAVRVLTEPQRRSYHLPWLEAVRPNLEQIDVEPLLALSPRSGWTPDFLSPVPSGPGTTVAEQLAQVRATPPDQVARELRLSLTRRGGDAPAPATVRRLLKDPERARHLLADVLERCWEVLISPHWPRLRDLLEADITYRSGMLGDFGLERVIAEMHPRVRWNTRGVTVTGKPAARRVLDGAGLVLQPSAFAWPDLLVIIEPPAQPTLVYPARGIAELWKPAVTARSDALGRLLGATRATLLQSLAEAASTMTLARRHGLSQGTVSEHLSTLHDAGLITRARQGHTVLYQHTPLGSALADGQDVVVGR